MIQLKKYCDLLRIQIIIFIICIFFIYLIIIINFKVISLSLIIILWIILPAAYISLLERQVVGIIQQRLGPIFGGGIFSLLNPILDGIKLFLRKGFDIKNSKQSQIVNLCIAYTLALTMSIWTFFYYDYSNINNSYSIFWILLILNINSYGLFFFSIVIGNKYSFLSIIRLISLVISYDIIIGLIFLNPVLLSNSISIYSIDTAQILNYYFLIIGPGLILYCILWITEARKVPFDTVESESEMASGYMQEMRGISFALLIITEYIGLFFLIILFIHFFLGNIWSISVYSFIIWLILLLFLNIRTILPNYRFDQIINIFWKYLFPFSILLLIFLRGYIYF